MQGEPTFKASLCECRGLNNCFVLYRCRTSQPDWTPTPVLRPLDPHRVMLGDVGQPQLIRDICSELVSGPPVGVDDRA